MSYESLRLFADTWGLVLLAVIFLGLILWIFRRGSTKKYRHAARIPLDVSDKSPDAPTAPAQPSTSAERDERS